MNRSTVRVIVQAQITALLALTVLASCAHPREPADPGAVSANQAWVQRACQAEMFDPSEWPRYQYSGVQIALPAPLKQTSTNPEYPVFVRTSRGTLSVWRHRGAQFVYDQMYNRVVPGQVSCAITYGRLPAEVISRYTGGEFLTAIRVAPASIGEREKWLLAVVRSKELADATVLRQALRTIAIMPSSGARP
jgi:hypothetical protein